jgi:hypothetical protein
MKRSTPIFIKAPSCKLYVILGTSKMLAPTSVVNSHFALSVSNIGRGKTDRNDMRKNENNFTYSKKPQQHFQPNYSLFINGIHFVFSLIQT